MGAPRPAGLLIRDHDTNTRQQGTASARDKEEFATSRRIGPQRPAEKKMVDPAKINTGAPAVPVTGVPIAGAGAVNQWSSGLCDCFDDFSLCCLTWWCPCITFGRIAEIVDRGSSSCGTSGALYALLAYLTGCQWIYSCSYRQKMRAQFRLADTTCCDCCVHFWCQACALCQEYRELKARGFDPVLGWQPQPAGDAAAAAYPPVPQQMGR